jgi:hypothetical protein
MTIRTICYASNPGYMNMAMRLQDIMQKWDLEVDIYTEEWLKQRAEYVSYPEVFLIPKGGGLWAWKPLVMLDALERYDRVLYLDSSVIPTNIGDVLKVFSMADPMCVHNYYDLQISWCKRECFEIMGCYTPRYWTANHVWAGVISATQSANYILKEWLNYCTNLDCIGDKTGIFNHEYFVLHRHDQSILANLATKYGLPRYRGPAFLDASDYMRKLP